MLSSSQIDFYRESGYLSLPGVLTDAQVAEGRRIVAEFVERSRAVTAHDDVFDLEPGHTAEHPRVRRLKDPVSAHPFFDSLMRSAAILDPISDLIGPAIRFQGNKLNMKSADFGSPVEWHQDFAFYPHTNDDLLAVGVAFDDCTLENGCLMVIPGSHRGPIFDHHQDGRFAGAMDPHRDGVDLSRAVPVLVPAGGISIHHTRLLHGSAPNRSSQPRRLLLYQYAAVDACPLSGVGDFDAYNAKIVRGKPTSQARMIDLQVRLPYPGPERPGSIYEIQTVYRDAVFAEREPVPAGR
jgi:ectoine hydroxylase-related dioxygenase (phytanoyl-CoA dioxygenase family)